MLVVAWVSLCRLHFLLGAIEWEIGPFGLHSVFGSCLVVHHGTIWCLGDSG